MQFSDWYTFLNWCEGRDSSLVSYDMVLNNNYRYFRGPFCLPL